jgi:hypothetical protein
MTVSMQRTLVALNLPATVPELIGVARAILVAMTGNGLFPRPAPSLAKVGAAIAALEAAEVEKLSRRIGTAAARNDKRKALVALLMRLKAYVQGVADDDPDRAAAIIGSAGMNVKAARVPAKPTVDAKAGRTPGSVRLIVRAVAKDASYEWEWSTDGGVTWRSAPVTLQAKTVLRGLPRETKCWFRFRATTRSGTRDWSDPVAFAVP